MIVHIFRGTFCICLAKLSHVQEVDSVIVEDYVNPFKHGIYNMSGLKHRSIKKTNDITLPHKARQITHDEMDP